MFNGKIHYTWSFSIAMFVYQRVSASIWFTQCPGHSDASTDLELNSQLVQLLLHQPGSGQQVTRLKISGGVHPISRSVGQLGWLFSMENKTCSKPPTRYVKQQLHIYWFLQNIKTSCTSLLFHAFRWVQGSYHLCRCCYCHRLLNDFTPMSCGI